MKLTKKITGIMLAVCILISVIVPVAGISAENKYPTIPTSFDKPTNLTMYENSDGALVVNFANSESFAAYYNTLI